MSVSFYKPNKSNKGSASSFNYAPTFNCVFAEIIKQSGWDESTRTGSFKQSRNDPTKHIIIKLGWHEVGSILDCIEKSRPFSTYHEQDDFPKSIKFEVWNQTLDDKITPKGFSFGIVVTDKKDAANKNSFISSFTFGEARYLREYLMYAMKLNFDILKDKKNPVKGSPQPTEQIIVNNQEEETVSNADPLTGF